MSPEEFADAHGLSLEEAQLILARRSQQSPDPNSRLALARSRLAETQKRVGVQPVVAEGEELVQMYDPDADVGVMEFYKTKVRETEPRIQSSVIQGQWVEGDWEEPP